MLWYVNPHNADQAINLTRISGMARKKQNIHFDTHVWSFEKEATCIKVYEEIVKLCQQTRYRLASVQDN